MAVFIFQFVVLLFVLLIRTSCHACCRQEHGSDTVTDKEIREVSEKLFKLDKNGARAGIDYVVDKNASKLRAIQTLYHPEVGVPEPVCPPCAPQEIAFLDAVMNTSVMNATHKFLKSKGLAATTRREFRSQLTQWWMHKYSRSEGKANDSCGFEHVFAVDLMGDGRVGGLHNWIYYYYSERSGKTKYLEFLQNCKPDVLTFRFSFLDRLKPIGGFSLGCSPELQMALATLCFRVRPLEGQECLISLGGNILNMHTFAMPEVKPTTFSTAYSICLT